MKMLPRYGYARASSCSVGTETSRERPHSALGYAPPERFARRLGAPALDEGPRPSPALAAAPRSFYDVNGSPSLWT
jgi:hypothetical protein